MWTTLQHTQKDLVQICWRYCRWTIKDTWHSLTYFLYHFHFLINSQKNWPHWNKWRITICWDNWYWPNKNFLSTFKELNMFWKITEGKHIAILPMVTKMSLSYKINFISHIKYGLSIYISMSNWDTWKIHGTLKHQHY